MKAIVTFKNKDGSYDKVGMNNRRVLGPLKTEVGLVNQARRLFGRPVRLEFFRTDHLHGEPYRVIYYEQPVSAFNRI